MIDRNSKMYKTDVSSVHCRSPFDAVYILTRISGKGKQIRATLFDKLRIDNMLQSKGKKINYYILW